MTQETINVGAFANDGTGDPLRSAFVKVNANFDELYANTGFSGYSGTRGVSGYSGTQGVSGTSGTQGTSGTSGTEGLSGTSGTIGVSGTSGSPGLTGATGVSGYSGFKGDTYATSSSTSLSIGTGSKTLFVSQGLSYTTSQVIKVAYDVNNVGDTWE